MTPLVIIFVAVFVVGPLAFLLFLRLAPSKRRSIGLVCLVVGSTGMSASLRYLSGGWGQDAFAPWQNAFTPWQGVDAFGWRGSR